MLISIITVVFNGEKTIRRTIESVLNQSFSNIEYIIIDGASTDATMSIVNEYKSRIYRIISESDNGIYDAMNKGIKYAEGDYICFINADDCLTENSCESIFREVNQGNIFDVYHGDIIYHSEIKSVNKRCRPRLESWYPRIIGMPYFHPTMYVSKKIYSQFLYDTSYKLLADYKLVQEIILRKFTVKYLPIVLAHFYGGGTSDENFYLGFKEGQLIRRELGFSFLTILLSTVSRFSLRYTIKTKRIIQLVTNRNQSKFL